MVTGVSLDEAAGYLDAAPDKLLRANLVLTIHHELNEVPITLQ